METRRVKAALKAMPIKTDRRDAEGIARLLQMGWFRPVHCKSVSSQETCALLTARRSVKDALTDMELSVRGVLRNFGLKPIHQQCDSKIFVETEGYAGAAGCFHYISGV